MHAKASSPRGRVGGGHVRVGSAEPWTRAERACGRHRYRSARGLVGIEHDARRAAPVRPIDAGTGCFTDTNGPTARAGGIAANDCSCTRGIADGDGCGSRTNCIAGADDCNAVGDAAAKRYRRRPIKRKEEDENDPATGDRARAEDRDGALAISQLGSEGISKVHSVREIGGRLSL